MRLLYISVLVWMLGLFFSCNKESIVQGDALSYDPGKGRLTIYSYILPSCGYLGGSSVFVDQKNIGRLTADYKGSEPKCGATTSTSIITIDLDEGLHTIELRGTQNCSRKFENVKITKAKCTLLNAY